MKLEARVSPELFVGFGPRTKEERDAQKALEALGGAPIEWIWLTHLRACEICGRVGLTNDGLVNHPNVSISASCSQLYWSNCAALRQDDLNIGAFVAEGLRALCSEFQG